ncbi:hypothetical protein Q5P01_023036 [Channa striata]|uniref:Uncharacterized protein n=1 Tax=Channa striata TaxID=64152 RepID=A0AA88LS53_CHASR|nr:hypothetical protein Q5P01_023036 [Channa striata]
MLRWPSGRSDEQDVRAAAVMRLGATEDFVQHFQPSGALVSHSPLANAAEAGLVLLQRHMVKGDFAPEFTLKQQNFYSRLQFPAELSRMINWKDVLMEIISVALLRTELLWQQNRYRELCRYLQVIQTDDITLLQQLQDLMPFLHVHGQERNGSRTKFTAPGNAPATCLSPLLFLFYLHVFNTATPPNLTVTQLMQLCSCDAPWQLIKGSCKT